MGTLPSQALYYTSSHRVLPFWMPKCFSVPFLCLATTSFRPHLSPGLLWQLPNTVCFVLLCSNPLPKHKSDPITSLFKTSQMLPSDLPVNPLTGFQDHQDLASTYFLRFTCPLPLPLPQLTSPTPSFLVLFSHLPEGVSCWPLDSLDLSLKAEKMSSWRRKQKFQDVLITSHFEKPPVFSFF